MKMQITTASRKKAYVKVGLFGPSGSGKTYSALLMARGMVNSWEEVCVIDTERGSAELYSALGPYKVLQLDAPFTPERYVEAISIVEQSGAKVIVIDSISHEWEGSGGILEEADSLSKGSKNSFTVWSKLTPRHNSFISKILSVKMNVICCGRSKQEYALSTQEKNGRVVTVPEKLGLKAITREGFDYELTISFDIAINHFASTSKDRTGIFMPLPEFQITQKTGEKIIEWINSGTGELEERINLDVLRAKMKEGDVSESQVLAFYRLADLSDLSDADLRIILKRAEMKIEEKKKAMEFVDSIDGHRAVMDMESQIAAEPATDPVDNFEII